MKIVLISCVSKKLGEKAKAGDLYISPLFKKNLAYAKSLNPDKIFILSAKYGLLNLDEEIESYDLTLNSLSVLERKKWAGDVLENLKQEVDLENNEFIFLAGEKYREFLIPYLKNFSVPMQGLGIGRQLGWLTEKLKKECGCGELHDIFNKMKRHSFPFDKNEIPENGIYILFEKDEKAHEGDRIVRVGTHTGDNQLRSRLKQHFLDENKDRSIFRKNIGRALLKKSGDDFLGSWEVDLTTKEARQKFQDKIDFEKQQEIEKKISEYIQDNFSFVVFRIDDKDKRLKVESKIISTVSNCEHCGASENWFGLNSPKEKIRKSGLWLVNELWKEGLTDDDFVELRGLVSNKNQTLKT